MERKCDFGLGNASQKRKTKKGTTPRNQTQTEKWGKGNGVQQKTSKDCGQKKRSLTSAMCSEQPHKEGKRNKTAHTENGTLKSLHNNVP